MTMQQPNLSTKAIAVKLASNNKRRFKHTIGPRFAYYLKNCTKYIPEQEIVK